MFQSTHPHGVRLVYPHSLLYISRVSIHAPTRGATAGTLIVGIDGWVSIHAPTRGATLPHVCLLQKRHVSIHAPTRGATHLRQIIYYGDWFQSTHPHGVRHMKRQMIHPRICFNPRTHTGCDLPVRVEFDAHQVSIHAPTRGATQIYADNEVIHVFQSTHPHGVRLG